MKTLLITVFIGVLAYSGFAQEHKHGTHDIVKSEAIDKNKKVMSPPKSAMAMVGEAHVHIDSCLTVIGTSMEKMNTIL